MNYQNQEACVTPTQVDSCNYNSSNLYLQKAIGDQTYSSILELGCGSRVQYRVLAKHVKPGGLYVGFNMQKDPVDQMKDYFETNKFACSLPNSHFFTREVAEVPHHNVFSLVCLEGLYSHMLAERTIKNRHTAAKVAMRNLVEKLLQIGKKVVIRVALQDQFECDAIGTLEVCETVCLLRNIPQINFQPLIFYQSIASGEETLGMKRGRCLETFPAESFEYGGVTVNFTYLVFT